MAGIKRPVATGETDAIGRPIKVSATAVETRASAPPPPSGVERVGQFVDNDAMAVEAGRCALEVGETMCFTVDDEGGSTGGLMIVDGGYGATIDEQIENAGVVGRYRWVTRNQHGQFEFGSYPTVRCMSCDIPTDGRTGDGFPCCQACQPVTGDDDSAGEDERPWSWETISEDVGPDVAAMLADRYKTVGAAVAAYTSMRPDDVRVATQEWLETEGQRLLLGMHSEIGELRPLGRPSEVPGLTKARADQVIVATPLGRFVFAKNSAPTEDDLARWSADHATADRYNQAADGYRFAPFDALPGETLGNRDMYANVERLHHAKLLTPAEWTSWAPVAAFWAAHPDAQSPTVAADGSIFDWDGSLDHLAAHGV